MSVKKVEDQNTDDPQHSSILDANEQPYTNGSAVSSDLTFDPDKFRLPQDFSGEVGIAELLSVQVRKPGRQTWFRVHLRGDGLLALDDGSLVRLEIAAWAKESDRAGKFLSLSIKLKGERQSTQPRANGGRPQFDNHVNQHGTAFDDEGVPPDDKDIPFALPGDLSPTRNLPRA